MMIVSPCQADCVGSVVSVAGCEWRVGVSSGGLCGVVSVPDCEWRVGEL